MVLIRSARPASYPWVLLEKRNRRGIPWNVWYLALKPTGHRGVTLCYEHLPTPHWAHGEKSPNTKRLPPTPCRLVFQGLAQ